MPAERARPTTGRGRNCQCCRARRLPRSHWLVVISFIVHGLRGMVFVLIIRRARPSGAAPGSVRAGRHTTYDSIGGNIHLISSLLLGKGHTHAGPREENLAGPRSHLLTRSKHQQCQTIARKNNKFMTKSSWMAEDNALHSPRPAAAALLLPYYVTSTHSYSTSFAT